MTPVLLAKLDAAAVHLHVFDGTAPRRGEVPEGNKGHVPGERHRFDRLQQLWNKSFEGFWGRSFSSFDSCFLFALFLAVPHSFLEEYYWRWFVFGQTRRITGVKAAIIISSLGFMSHHVIVIHQFLDNGWQVTLFFSLCVATGGVLWAWLYNKYKTLYGAWVSHLMVDLGIMYIGYDLTTFAG